MRRKIWAGVGAVIFAQMGAVDINMLGVDTTLGVSPAMAQGGERGEGERGEGERGEGERGEGERGEGERGEGERGEGERGEGERGERGERGEGEGCFFIDDIPIFCNF